MAAADRFIDQKLPDSAETSRQFVSSIHERFDGALRRFLRNKLRSSADVDDVAQEVYLRFSKLDNPCNIVSDRAFLFTTATNLIRDRSRRLVTQLEKASVSTDGLVLESISDDPAQRVLDAERIQLAAEALDRICENSRTAFYLSRIEGRSYTEIAQTMQVSVSMVEKHISSALACLRESMD